MSNAEKHSHYFGPSQTPNITKGKADLINSKSDFSHPYDEDVSENSYMTVEKKSKNKFVREDSDSSSSYIKSNKYGRSTVTPSRSGIKSKMSVYNIGPEAFIQPTADECQNLIVNLEDIVKEEQMIYNIQECLNKKIDISNTCQRWWDLAENSSVREMQLFFEEESSRKYIRIQQILLVMTFGYAELMYASLSKNTRNMTSVKNILSNMHKNYLIFVEFI